VPIEVREWVGPAPAPPDVGIDHDTAAFAVSSIRPWHQAVGHARYEDAGHPLPADGGGSNGSRVRLWKLELQKLADETGLILQVFHTRRGYRSGTRSSTACSATSPRPGAESHSSASRLAVVQLIAATTTKTGLTVRGAPDENRYPKAIRVSDAEMPTLNIVTDEWHQNGITPSDQGHQDEAVIVLNDAVPSQGTTEATGSAAACWR
jgi:Rhodopirellula transposase DDE domain